MATEHESRSEEVVRYVDGEMSADEARAFEAHLATCAQCQAEAAAAELIGTEFEVALGRPPLSRAEADALVVKLRGPQRVPETAPETAKVVTRRTQPFYQRRWVQGLALAAVVAALAVGAALSLRPAAVPDVPLAPEQAETRRYAPRKPTQQELRDMTLDAGRVPNE